MKGIIFILLEKVVTEAHGEDTWDALLEKSGDIHVMGEASNGQEAMEMVEQFKPDVLIMDIMKIGRAHV